MAVTNPEARPSQRASMFIVPTDTPGVEILRDVPTMEHPWEQLRRTTAATPKSPTRGCASPPRRCSAARARASSSPSTGSCPGRIHHCMRWLGVARRAFDMMCERATYRHAHGSLLAQKQTVQNWVADSAAEMQAARLMTLHAAWTMDTQGASAARTQVALIKFFGAKVLHDVVDRALQLHGSLGYSTDLPLEQMYRFARAARIYDGPDEVHRQSVARHILAGYEPPADGVPSEHLPTRRAPGARALRRAAGGGHRQRLSRAAHRATSPPGADERVSRTTTLRRWQRAPSSRRWRSTRALRDVPLRLPRARRARGGHAPLRLDGGEGGLEFTERVALPVSGPLDRRQSRALQGLLSLLHWVAGVSYYKAALPPASAASPALPGPAAAALLEALYSEGLGELAYVNAPRAAAAAALPGAGGNRSGGSRVRLRRRA